MGLKEKFMENMMNQMSFAEKKDMMNEMMGRFFGGMSESEKKEMMSEMMGRMMGESGGGDRSHPMMSMMNSMMNPEGGGEDFNPMDMCKKMMAGMGQSPESGSSALSARGEIESLFEEWARQMDEEILGLLDSATSADLGRLAAQLKISKDSLIYFLARLARQGKITLKPEPVRPAKAQ